jgi:dihydrofolate reductase
MRTLKIMEHLSLDGLIAPGGRGEDSAFEDGGWSAPYRTPAGAAAVAEAFGTNFDLLLGRRTYDLWAAFWPKTKGGPFADALNAATKYVATHRPDSLAWAPAAPLGPDLLDAVRPPQSHRRPRLVLCGSSTLTSLLLEHGLVEEVVLATYPLLLGQGKRLFSETADRLELALLHTKSTPTGIQINTYKHIGPLRTKSPATPNPDPPENPA